MAKAKLEHYISAVIFHRLAKVSNGRFQLGSFAVHRSQIVADISVSGVNTICLPKIGLGLLRGTQRRIDNTQVLKSIKIG